MRPVKHTVAILAPRPDRSEVGGAERFYTSMWKSLSLLDITAEIIEIPAPEADFHEIMENYSFCYDLDLSEFDSVISTKAPTHLVQHRNHICYLQHLVRAYYEMFESVFPPNYEIAKEHQKAIQRVDTLALNSVKKLFTIGSEVSRRLLNYNGLRSEVLYQGSEFLQNDVLQHKSNPNAAEHFLFVSRIHPWKRPLLALDAMLHTRTDARLIIAGRGDMAELVSFVASNPILINKVEFASNPTDAALSDLYSRSVGVIFPPIYEDFGLITLEAARHRKPILTCIDSGEPANLVRRYSSGVICRPIGRDVGNCVDYLWSNRDKAEQMGHRAWVSLSAFNWELVGRRLAQEMVN